MIDWLGRLSRRTQAVLAVLVLTACLLVATYALLFLGDSTPAAERPRAERGRPAQGRADDVAGRPEGSPGSKAGPRAPLPPPASPGLPVGGDELLAAAAAGRSGVLAYVSQRSDETAEQRANRLRNVFTPGSPAPVAAPPFDRREFRTKKYEAAGTVAIVEPIGGTSGDYRFLFTLTIQMASFNGFQATDDRRNVVFEVSVTKIGDGWRPVNVAPPRGGRNR